MAITSRIDELNVLGNSQKKERPNIRKFFEEMELPKEEIEERITVANQLYTTINYAFLLMLATKKVDKKINYPYYSDYIERYFTDVLSQNGYDTTDEYYQEYLRETSEEVIDTTQKNGAGEYYLSTDRAETIAENTTNAVANYKREQDAIKQGYTMKRWVSLIDKHTRKTHVHADGKEVKIGTPFTIGGFKMMFPLDGSLCGFSNPQEVINCRCVCKYFGKDKTIASSNNEKHDITDSSIENVSFVDYDDGVVNSQWLINRSKDLLQYAKDNNNSNEVAYFFDRMLNQVDDYELGTKSNVNLPTYKLAKSIGVLHNHPNNKSFSNVDIFEFIEDNISYMGVVKNSGEIEMLRKREDFSESKSITALSRAIKYYQNDIDKNEELGYDKAIRKFLKDPKSGIDYYR